MRARRPAQVDNGLEMRRKSWAKGLLKMLAKAAIVGGCGATTTDVEDGGGERNAVGRFQAYASAVVKRDGHEEAEVRQLVWSERLVL